MKQIWRVGLGLLAVMGVVSYFLLSNHLQSDKTIPPDRDFQVSDTQNITKIFLADKLGEKILLERQKDGTWLVNGKYKAFEPGMSVLLNTIQQVRVKYIPPNSAVPNLVKDIASHGIKVEIYGKSGKKLKTYYVGGNTQSEDGTAFIMEGYEQPYIVYMPSLLGGLRSRYRVREHQIIDRWIFREDPEKIKSISVEYPGQRNKSFLLDLSQKKPQVQPFYATTPPINGDVFMPAVEAFLYGFEKIGAEGIVIDQVERDSVLKLIPFCTIMLQRNDGSMMDISLWPIIDMVEEDATKFENPQKEYFIERYYAYSEATGLFYLTQHLIFEKILWSYGDFFDKSSLVNKNFMD